MSNAGLSDRDEAVLGFVEEEMADISDDADTPAEELADVRELCRDLASRLDAVEHEQQQAAGKRRDIFKRLRRIEERLDDDGTVTGSTELEQYATAPEQIRKQLSANKKRAVTLYEDWTDVAWRPDANEENLNKWRVDTARRLDVKNQPSRLKHELEQREGETLSWNDVYRTMKQMAKMSGGEEEVDSYGRSHIVGGDYEYHERPTADNSRMKRVLKEVTDDE